MTQMAVIYSCKSAGSLSAVLIVLVLCRQLVAVVVVVVV